MALSDEVIYSTMHSDCRLWHVAEVRVIKLAVAILTEDAGTTNHANRLVWAKAALQTPADKVREMKTQILFTSSIASDPDGATSSQVENAIIPLINQFATG